VPLGPDDAVPAVPQSNKNRLKPDPEPDFALSFGPGGKPPPGSSFRPDFQPEFSGQGGGSFTAQEQGSQLATPGDGKPGFRPDPEPDFSVPFGKPETGQLVTSRPAANLNPDLEPDFSPPFVPGTPQKKPSRCRFDESQFRPKSLDEFHS
jgi:hypothetical protein